MRKRPVLLAIATLAVAACARSNRVASTEWPDLRPLSPSDSNPRMVVSGGALEVDFPAVPIARIGCPADSGRRLYYWMATADYGTRYPDNHFQQVVAWFKLPQNITVGTSQFDSALARQVVEVVEAAGEPPMEVNKLASNRARIVLEPVPGDRLLRARMFVEGRTATRSIVATRADSVSLGWCDASRPYMAVTVPLRRP